MASAATTPGAVTSEATGYQMDAAHDGVQPVSSLGPNLSQVWSAHLGGAASYAVVVGSDVYTGDAGKVVALSATTGHQLWSTSVAGTYPYLADDAGTLFVESDGVLYALNPTDGDIKWSNAEGDLNGPPEAADGVVVAQSETGPVAFSESTGKVDWASDFGGTVNYGTVPVIANGSVLFDGGTFTAAYSLGSGNEEWKYQYRGEDDQGANTSYADGVLYSPDTTLQFEASSGAVDGVASSYFTPAADGQRTFAEQVDPDTGVTSTLAALDNVTGDLLWNVSTGTQVAVAPVVANGYVITATTSGQLTMWAEATGTKVWTGTAGADISESPADPSSDRPAPVTSLAVAGDEVIVPTDEGLVAFAGQGPNGCSPEGCPAPVESHRPGTPTSATDPDLSYLLQRDHSDAQPSDPLTVPAKKLWTRTLGAPAAYPLIVDGRVFVVAGNWLWALDGATGQVDWGPVDTGGGQLAYSQSLFLVNEAGWIMSFNPVTGARNWIQAIPLTFDGALVDDLYEQAPIATGGVLYAVGSGPYAALFPFSGSTGLPLGWVAESDASSGGTPAVSDGDLFAAFDGGDAYALNPSGPGFLWQNTTGNEGGSSLSPAVFGGDVWATGYELKAANGQKVRSLPDSLQQLQPAFVGTEALFTTSSGALEATNLSLQTKWIFKGDGTLDTNPIADGADVFVGSKSGNLYGIDLATGALAWHTTLPGPITTDAADSEQSAQSIGLGDGFLVVPTGTSVTVFGD
jgi:outer membrane protein assembly factor BamB